MWDKDVVAAMLHGDAQTPEGVRYDTQLVVGGVADGDAVAHHGSHADERADLNHVWQDGVGGAVQTVHAVDG